MEKVDKKEAWQEAIAISEIAQMEVTDEMQKMMVMDIMGQATHEQMREMIREKFQQEGGSELR